MREAIQSNLVFGKISPDHSNLYMIFGAFFISHLAPYETFILAYSILGPLHYLTEINWLNRRPYKNLKLGKWILWSSGAALFIAVPKIILEYTPNDSSIIQTFSSLINAYSNGIIFLAFCSAFITLWKVSSYHKLLAFSLAILLALMINAVPL